MSTIIPVDEISVGGARERKPEWLRVKMPSGENYQRVKQLMQVKNLHTVCEEAMCPNLGHCWGRGTATFPAKHLQGTERGVGSADPVPWESHRLG